MQPPRYQHKRRLLKRSFCSLRQTFNTRLAGVDPETRRAMAGHATEAANDDYSHVDLAKLRNAVEKLPDLASLPEPFNAA